MAFTGKEAELLVMTDHDNVATALRDIPRGTTVRYTVGDEACQLTVLDAIPFGHKVAIVNLAVGDKVTKYGEIIGQATSVIQSGQHVHVHNVDGIRGRGDLHRKGVDGQ